MKKKNYLIIILVAILFLVAGGVVTYFIMNSSNDKDSNYKEPTIDNNNNQEENNSEESIVDSNNKEENSSKEPIVDNNNKDENSSKNPIVEDNNVQVENKGDSNNNVKYADWMDYIMKSDIKSIKLNYCNNELEDKTVQINKNDLNRIFEELKKGNLQKIYGSGFGSPCNQGIVITYTNNNVKHDFELMQYMLISDNVSDKKLLSLVEQGGYELFKESAYTGDDYTFTYQYNMGIVYTIIDEYTK